MGMSEILIVLIQFIISLIIEFIPWILIEFLCFNKVLLIFSGLAAGGISVYLHPEHIISVLWLRTLNLIITPFLLAGFVQWLEDKITGFKKFQKKDYTFWDVYLFALAFAMIRYFFA